MGAEVRPAGAVPFGVGRDVGGFVGDGVGLGVGLGGVGEGVVGDGVVGDGVGEVWLPHTAGSVSPQFRHEHFNSVELS